MTTTLLNTVGKYNYKNMKNKKRQTVIYGDSSMYPKPPSRLNRLEKRVFNVLQSISDHPDSYMHDFVAEVSRRKGVISLFHCSLDDENFSIGGMEFDVSVFGFDNAELIISSRIHNAVCAERIRRLNSVRRVQL